MTREYIEREPGWVATFRPDESGWNLCLLDENPDRPLVLELSRLPRLVSLRGDRAFRRGLSAGRAQPACLGASGLDFGPSSGVGLRICRRLQGERRMRIRKGASIMLCQDCGSTIEEGWRDRAPVLARFCLQCRSEHRRWQNLKYAWLPQHDAYLRAHYHGGLHQRGRVIRELARQTGFPRWHIKR